MSRPPRRTWYSEQGTEERPSAIPGMVDLYRAGKFIASVPASKPDAETSHDEQDRMQRGGNYVG